MCGIAGYVGKRASLEEDYFRLMQDCLVHRGPDDDGTWRSQDRLVTLGSRRLAILDRSEMGHMPMVSRSGKLVIVLNGEIYNYLELRDLLGQKGYSFSSGGDTEVLLTAYEEWGSDCLSRLNGMFAFAVWDVAQKKLFAARDRFGEKPLFYCYDRERETFVFASEMKALFASGLIDPVANPSAVHSFMTAFRADHDQSTMFRGVSSLRGGYALTLSSSDFELKTWRYWDLNPEAEIHLEDDTAYTERLLELLNDSVRLRLRSDVPVGSSLSGGLDSSTIVGLMARQYRGDRQATFSARFRDAHVDEGRFIKAVCDFTGVENHAVYPDPARYCEEAELIAWHQEEPFHSSSIYAQWEVMRLARDCNVTVLLDGQGADEILAGYSTYLGAHVRGLILGGDYRGAWNSIRAHDRHNTMTSLPVAMSTLVPLATRITARRLLRHRELSREFEQSVPKGHINGRNPFVAPLKRELYATLMHNVLPGLLRYADRNSMAFSREVRLPFLDHRLVEFMFGIPTDQIVRGGVSKAILRDAIRGVVPEVVRERRDKIGFATPEQSWMRSGPMRTWVRDLICSREFLSRPWIDPKIVSETWKSFEVGDSQAIKTTWKWLSLETWARVFLDGAWRGLQSAESSLKPRSAGARTWA
jgi:asparagine synthase (glutamine-hydrolysing)